MRKLSRDNKDVNKLDNVIASCRCIQYCAGDSAAMLTYRHIQDNNARHGGNVPFKERKYNR